MNYLIIALAYYLLCLAACAVILGMSRKEIGARTLYMAPFFPLIVLLVVVHDFAEKHL